MAVSLDRTPRGTAALSPVSHTTPVFHVSWSRAPTTSPGRRGVEAAEAAEEAEEAEEAVEEVEVEVEVEVKVEVEVEREVEAPFSAKNALT